MADKATNPLLRVLARDEPATKSQKVEGDKVHFRFTVKTSKESPTRYEMPLTIDVAGMSETELKLWAAKRLLIDVQRSWRGEKTDKVRLSDKYVGATFKGRDMIDAARAVADPDEKGKKFAASMTREGKLELLQALRAELEDENEDGDT